MFLPRGWAVGSAAGFLSLAIGSATGCGSDSSCEETRSCKGTPGTGGGGGDSGPDAPAACETDDDCENGLVCDGVSTCVNKVCVAGTPVVCTSPDPAHCTSTCAEPSGDCEVSPNDLDGDDHLDPDCASPTNPPTLPADDCDDSKGTVYPGADEICDGLDNDCDAMADFSDGLLLSGTTSDFVVSTAQVGHPAIAWASTAQHYGVVWEDLRVIAGDEEVFFALMDPSGAKVGSDIQVSDAADQSVWPRIAWGNDSFGIVWGDTRNGNFDIYFRRLDATGAPLTAEKPLITDSAPNEVADIISIPDGWVVVFEDTATEPHIYGVRIDLDGNVTKPKTLIGTQTGKHAVPRIAALGNEFGMMWSKLGSTTTQYRVGFLRSDFDFNVSGQIDLSPVAAANTGGLMGDIGVNAAKDGYLAAYRNYQLPEYLSYGELAADGSFTCGPESIGSAVTQGAVSDIVSYAGGSVFLLTNGVGASVTVAIAISAAGCSQLLPVPIDTAGIAEINPSIGGASSGEAGVAMVWADQALNKIRSRAMGPHLCD